MRVSDKMIFETARQNLFNLTEELNRANMVVSSQNRLLKLSDDPVGLTQALNMRSSLSNIGNISFGKSWLASSESAQTSVQNLVSDTKVLCVQMATATIGAAQRLSAAGAVEHNLKEIVALSNTEVCGRYIFAGSNTGTAAFTIDGNNDVTYNGDNNAFTVKIGRNASVEIGGDGQAVFQPSGAGLSDDIFVIMKDLI
ncbi:MAG: flagellar hook-associated protein FlgL, partial [Deltaproteobacteria bacterium]|nr:flagellar hook-associated protein FlgL [Deltaproteobacteria bacterium]